jgi:hypothetical protein
MLRSCPVRVAQVRDAATQVPRRSCAGVRMMLRRVKCVAEQVTGTLAHLHCQRCEAITKLFRYCLTLMYKCYDAGVHVTLSSAGDLTILHKCTDFEAQFH